MPASSSVLLDSQHSTLLPDMAPKGSFMNKPYVAVIGSLNMDLKIKVDHFPQPGETMLCSSIVYQEGGKGANQACACGLMGVDTYIAGCVGQDETGTKLIRSLQRSGVNTDSICRLRRTDSGMAIIYVNNAGENAIAVISGANSQFDQSYFDSVSKLIAGSAYVLIQMEIPSKMVFEAVRLAHSSGSMVILNPAPAPDKIPSEIWKQIDIITPNEHEASHLCGISEDEPDFPEKCAGQMIRSGVKRVIITLGANGCYYADADKRKYYPACKTEAVDTTGAGDCFNGVLAAELCKGRDIDDAIMSASMASSIAVSRPGAQASYPNLREVEEAVRKFQS